MIQRGLPSSPAARARRASRLLVLVLGLVAIVAWQNSFRPAEVELDQHWTITASRGVQWESRFYFFLRHLGLYPVESVAPILADTKEEAQRHFTQHASSLRMDEGLTFRSGDRGRTYLYFVSTWFDGYATGPSLKPAGFVGFTAALCALFFAFWWIEQTPFGALLVVLLGSHPFQLTEIYRKDNVFGWSIISAIVLLALHVPLMVRAPKKTLSLAIPVVAGVWLATMRTIRSEGVAMALSCLVTYLFAERTSMRRKLVMIGLFAVTFVGSGKLYDRHFRKKFEQTQAAIRDVGGTPFEGRMVLYHEIWPAVWGGLGDFDTKYGYVWDDRVNYRYAFPIMKEKYGVVLPPWDPNNWSFDARNDYEKLYPYYFLEAPRYEDALREKVLHDIRHDPDWYVDILKKRVWRILTEGSPVSVSTSWFQVGAGAGLFGIAAIPLLAFLLLTRRWMLAKLLFFLTPLSATAFLIYSGGGTQGYGCFHVVAAAILMLFALRGARHVLRAPLSP